MGENNARKAYTIVLATTNIIVQFVTSHAVIQIVLGFALYNFYYCFVRLIGFKCVLLINYYLNRTCGSPIMYVDNEHDSVIDFRKDLDAIGLVNANLDRQRNSNRDLRDLIAKLHTFGRS